MKYIAVLIVMVFGALLIGALSSEYASDKERYQAQAETARYQAESEAELARYQAQISLASIQAELTRAELELKAELASIQAELEQARAETARAYAPVIILALLAIIAVSVCMMAVLAFLAYRRREKPQVLRYQIIAPPDNRQTTGAIVKAEPRGNIIQAIPVGIKDKVEYYEYYK